MRALAGVAFVIAALFLTTGCLSPKYKHAGKKTPAAVMLNVNFPPAPLEATLNTLIVSGGPGSWKKEAFWDEYVVTFHNAGEQPLQIAAVKVVDFAGTPRSPGDDPWKLEKESKNLARRYRDAGMTVVRVAAPRVLATTAEPSVAAGAAIGGVGAATAATATAVAIPVYGATVLGINLHNKKAITSEFKRRRLGLPLTLAPGESRTGSLFFPMVPNPQSLVVSWSSESEGSAGARDSTLPLDFLQGLHVKRAAAKDSTPSATGTPHGPEHR